MSKCEFNVNISPVEAFNMVKDNVSAELIDDEIRSIGEGKYLGVLVFEKYFMRVGNRASLVVVIDNIDGETKVKFVGSGGGTGMIFSFDWGAGGDFANSVKKILEGYIVG